ncbi:MAG: MBL fold metallo-hydrolase [Candidatus Marinimicrobia bacterium]|jgi:glyoxylase-like metal-dependent hydrolase (beta-lactamase superfamily II)|nr:MBL fold metallo-hydrolase [Candidatus Neomarinimicrobiota bacterium]MDP7336912.1 MBL fold metallo-hydrolase [Candidatus Neomarinimicrobiota bacterium]HJN68912.1 MBL fold metallo-hydrolase [Candidatus Neomarinimicrobiota bacterium]|tara:strand:- start:889 stop:1770 length:882 start_codon:yes stop_codon:yes gene_type:complete
MRKTSSFFICFFITASLAQDFDAIKIKTKKLSESIYMLEGSGGNIGVCIGEDGTFIIDDQFAPLTEKITAAIGKITPKPVQFLINTHWHYDHTDGNENFGSAGAIIVSHENSRKRMARDEVIALFGIEQKAYSRDGLPKITFKESMSFHYNGETINIFHIGQAHTDGDAIVHFVESNVLHMGDVFVRYGFPFIDEPNGGNINGMIETLDKVAELANNQTQIIPGHGQVSNRKDLLDYRKMLVTIRDRIKIQVGKGKTLKQIIASNPTQGYEGSDIFAKDDFVKIVYDSIKKSE